MARRKQDTKDDPMTITLSPPTDYHLCPDCGKPAFWFSRRPKEDEPLNEELVIIQQTDGSFRQGRFNDPIECSACGVAVMPNFGLVRP